MIDPGIGIKNLGRCLKEAEPEAFIAIPKAHIARIVCGWCKKSMRISVTVGKRLFYRGYTLTQIMAEASHQPYVVFEPSPEQMAAILQNYYYMDIVGDIFEGAETADFNLNTNVYTVLKERISLNNIAEMQIDDLDSWVAEIKSKFGKNGFMDSIGAGSGRESGSGIDASEFTVGSDLLYEHIGDYDLPLLEVESEESSSSSAASQQAPLSKLMRPQSSLHA